MGELFVLQGCERDGETIRAVPDVDGAVAREGGTAYLASSRTDQAGRRVARMVFD